MNNFQLLNRCEFLFDSLVELKNKDGVVGVSKTLSDAYRETYKVFYESLSKLINNYFDVLNCIQVPYSELMSQLPYWEHKWHFISKVVNSELSMVNQTKHIMVDNFFRDIREAIIANLIKSKTEIIVVMAWLTDPEILQKLLMKRKEGVDVQIIIAELEENFSNTSYIKLLFEEGASVSVSKTNSEGGMMHNKFCVIDKTTVITGSYDWTYKATLNSENITIIRDNILVSEDFLNKFKHIKSSSETVKLEEYLS